MKTLIIFSIFAALTAQAQNFSPSAGAVALPGSGPILNQASPSTSGAGSFTSPSATLNSTSPTGAGTVLSQPPLGDGSQPLNQINTAPSPIPSDTSLIQTPSNDPLMQSQEEQINTIPNVINPTPETETGSGTGTGTDQGPRTNNVAPFDTFPETTP